MFSGDKEPLSRQESSIPGFKFLILKANFAPEDAAHMLILKQNQKDDNIVCFHDVTSSLHLETVYVGFLRQLGRKTSYEFQYSLKILIPFHEYVETKKKSGGRHVDLEC